MTDINDLFIRASRGKFRFSSVRGDLTVEQLWDLPLTSKSGADLDTVAKTVNAELRETSEDSFVATSTNPRKGVLESMLEVAKFVIAAKQADAAKVRDAAAKADERRKIYDILASRETEKLSTASEEDLRKRLAELES